MHSSRCLFTRRACYSDTSIRTGFAREFGAVGTDEYADACPTQPHGGGINRSSESDDFRGSAVADGSAVTDCDAIADGGAVANVVTLSHAVADTRRSPSTRQDPGFQSNLCHCDGEQRV